MFSSLSGTLLPCRPASVACCVVDLMLFLFFCCGGELDEWRQGRRHTSSVMPRGSAPAVEVVREEDRVEGGKRRVKVLRECLVEREMRERRAGAALRQR